MRCRSSVRRWTATTTNSRQSSTYNIHSTAQVYPCKPYTRVAKEKLVLGAIRTTTTAKQQRRSTTRYVWNSPQKYSTVEAQSRKTFRTQTTYIPILLLLQNSNRVLLSNNTITAHNIRKTCLCCYCITLVFCHCALCVC